jgi:hypothetical protein
MQDLTLEQKVDALIATSPLRYLLKSRVSLWMSWDEKMVTLAGIKVGDVEWSRPVIVSARKLTIWEVLRVSVGMKVDRGDHALKDYSVLDLVGQKWLGRGRAGEVANFAKCKEI